MAQPLLLDHGSSCQKNPSIPQDREGRLLGQLTVQAQSHQQSLQLQCLQAALPEQPCADRQGHLKEAEAL